MQTGELVFNKYEIIRIIKESKDVSVYQAKHIYLNSFWIIKKIHKDHPIYINEIHMLKSLSHESIPLITDIFKENDSTYLIREYVEGDTLGEYISTQNAISEDKTIEIGIKICQALEYLHTAFEEPLIYRDIKPDNIVMSKNNRIKLIDFGIARFYQKNKDADTEYLGTRGFAAPEQYGMGQTDVRTDIFGVGVLLYYMLTKKNLDSVSSRLEPIRYFRTDIRPELEKIIQKACQFNRDQRYNSISDMKNALLNIQMEKKETSLIHQLLPYKNKIITVTGIKSGCGATHIVSSMAGFLKRKNKQCMMIDLSDSQALMTLEYTEDVVVDGGMLTWNNIPLIGKNTQQELGSKKINQYLEQCDWIILDLGKHRDQNDQEIYGRHHIVVSGLAQWEMTWLEDYLLEDIGRNTTIFINYSSDNQVQMLNQSLRHLFVYPYPYGQITNEEKYIFDEFYEGIFKDWGEEIQCSSEVKAEAFLNIDKFKIKFLKNIKS